MMSKVICSAVRECVKSVLYDLIKEYQQNQPIFLSGKGESIFLDEGIYHIAPTIIASEPFQEEDDSDKYFTPKRREMPSGLFAKMMENL